MLNKTQKINSFQVPLLFSLKGKRKRKKTKNLEPLVLA